MCSQLELEFIDGHASLLTILKFTSAIRKINRIGKYVGNLRNFERKKESDRHKEEWGR